MKMNRLFEMVYLLLEKKTMTAKELAEYFGVSTRTIYRDMDVLSQANIPIYTNQGKGGGICLLEEFVLDKSILSEEEQNQILFALQSLEKISPNQEKKVLDKMTSFFQKSATDWIHIDFSDWGMDEKQDDTFLVLKEAILTHHVLIFTYFNSYGQERKRKVEPLQIYFKDKAWYLKAFCQEKQDYRFFKIARMQEVEMLEEIFKRELPKKEERKKETIKVVALTLEIGKELAYRVFDEFKKEMITVKENGDFIVEAQYPDNDWVDGYLLSFGEKIKIISPIEVRERINEKFKKMIKNYS